MFLSFVASEQIDCLRPLTISTFFDSFPLQLYVPLPVRMEVCVYHQVIVVAQSDGQEKLVGKVLH